MRASRLYAPHARSGRAASVWTGGGAALASQGGAGAPRDAPAAWFVQSPEPGADGHHRCAACAHGRDDLFGIDPLEIDRGRAEIGALVRREPAPDFRVGREAPELAADSSS